MIFFVNGNTIIECHGKQHYEYCGFPTSVDYQKANDEYKLKLAKENGIEYYIVIDCRESNSDFIFNNIKNSELSTMYDLSCIDIKHIESEARQKFLFVVIDQLKKTPLAQDTADILKVNVSTIYKYINIAEELNIYTYDRELVQEKKEKKYEKHLDRLAGNQLNVLKKIYILMDWGH